MFEIYLQAWDDDGSNKSLSRGPHQEGARPEHRVRLSPLIRSSQSETLKKVIVVIY